MKINHSLNQELDKEKAIKHILPKVKHDYEEIKNGSFYDFIFKKIEKTKLEHSIQDPFSVTNGHDITKILYLILTYQLIWQINYPDFEYSFLDSISLDYFYQTLLYNQVTVKYDIFIKNHNN